MPRTAAARVRLQREVRHNRDVVLSRGSGYGTAAGSPLVRALQIRLSRAGYRPGSIDGLYGPHTQASVAAFQGVYGLAIDGRAGPRTLRELTARTPTLYPGAGRAVGGVRPVRVLQHRLARAGYSPGPVDGVFGPGTERAVRRYQAARGLPVTGVAGPRTIARLQPQSIVRERPRTARPASPKPRTHPRFRTSEPRQTTHPATGHPRSRIPSGSSTGWELPAGGLLLLIAGWYLRRQRGKRLNALPTTARFALPAPAVAAALPEAASTLPHPAEPIPAAVPPSGATNRASALRVEDELQRAGERAEAAIAFNTAVSLERQGDRAAARAAYDRAERAGHAAAATHLGVMMEFGGDLEGAQAAYARADQRGDPDGAFNLGCLLDEQGDFAGALDAYERADQRGHAEAATNLGMLMEVRGHIADARAAYERAERRGDPNGAANLGAMLEELGERSAAKAAYRRAKRMRVAKGHGTNAVQPPEPIPREARDPTYARQGDRA